MASLYGKGWRKPNRYNHGPWPKQPDELKIRQAMVEKLSVTAWGNVPYATRRKQCPHTPESTKKKAPKKSTKKPAVKAQAGN